MPALAPAFFISRVGHYGTTAPESPHCHWLTWPRVGPQSWCVMKSAFPVRLITAVFLASAIGAAVAQDASPGKAPVREARHELAQNILRLLPADSVTEHSIATPQGKLDYTATA